MIRLRLEEFSCIRDADWTLGQLNVLIGPQASGKSVLSKLAYFFIDLLSEQYEQINEQKPFEQFAEDVKTRFSEWFPVSAWGGSKFKIEFELGEAKFRLTRTSYDDSVRNNLRFWASNFVKEHYRETSELAKSMRQKRRSSKSQSAAFADLEVSWEVRSAANKKLREQLGADFVGQQIFIPAGRSFFTTLGRAFMAFDQSSTLDPITIRFGRLYSAYQDEFRFRSRTARRGTKFERSLSSILGGTIMWEGQRPVLRSEDGRTVPFFALSSGQQELLPLMVALTFFGLHFSDVDASELLYIEEPEAHLFPSAQSQLVQGLAALVDDSRNKRIALTTHSPYVLSKINNLIKAGSLEKKLDEPKRKVLDELVPAAVRIKPGVTKAYALVEGNLRSILDEDGLIAADYLDSISGEIGKEFSSLLGLEYAE